ncbi:MAG: hypothetical protein GY772_06400 [bacterium]|nr:hypothetical protein [bacterium]
MSSALRCEVAAYQLCVLDDIVQEAVHRDVTHISARAPASKLAFRAATLRLDQNIELWDAANALGQDTDAAFDHWRTVALCEGQRIMRPLRVARFLDCVYRGGDVALKDWGALQPVMEATAAETVKERLAEGTKLKEEYLRAVFLQGTVVSFPVGVDAEGAAWHGRPLAEAVAAMERTATAFEYVEVLNSNVATRKLALTARARAIKSMVVPVAVLRMSA